MRRFHRFPLTSLALLAALGTGGGLPAKEPPITLGLPLDCEPGRTCEIIKYVDHDPGPGLRDYACGNRNGGENGYGSTSFAIRDRKTMEAGVAVRAAAPGVVDKTRDEMADTGVYGPETREELTQKGCGNAVVLRHDEGWRTVYCHLKRGSVRVAPGDRVTAGQDIGQVGMSGLSELPHLYFSVRRGDTVIDPFVGELRAEGCGIGERPLWAADVLAKLPYKPVLPRLSGFSTDPPNVVEARKGSYADAVFTQDTATLYFWVEIIGAKAGDVLRIRLTGPDGKALSNGSQRVERATAQSFIAGKADRPAAGWTPGSYEGVAAIEHNGQSFATSARIDLR
ncbi:MAG TPA: M23 family metallopeptidase [Azospirillaceae bacterium]|nr:M23 family metallopeptidase [Azospirillaceae bacterium]